MYKSKMYTRDNCNKQDGYIWILQNSKWRKINKTNNGEMISDETVGNECYFTRNIQRFMWEFL